MQYFFNYSSPVGKSTIVPPNWRFVKDGLNRNLKTVTDYYNSRIMSVKSNHLLVRLLTGLGVSMTHQIERYHQIVEAKALQYSAGFKLTSSISKGALFKGVFFGDNYLEALIATDETFNPYEARDNWESLKPVTCVYHNKSDLDLLIPNGKIQSTDEGVAVIAINIPMLAVQFRCFLEETFKNFEENNAILQSAATFVHMYVLPGMLESQLNIAMFNRAYNLLTGRPMSESLKKHPFYITDFGESVDKIYLDQIKFFKQSNKDFSSILRTFQTATGSFQDALELPSIASTRQVVWAEVLARITAIEFMAKLSTDGGWKNNTATMNDFMITLGYYSRDKTLRQAIPEDTRVELDRSVSSIFGVDYVS